MIRKSFSAVFFALVNLSAGVRGDQPIRQLDFKQFEIPLPRHHPTDTVPEGKYWVIEVVGKSPHGLENLVVSVEGLEHSLTDGQSLRIPAKATLIIKSYTTVWMGGKQKMVGAYVNGTFVDDPGPPFRITEYQTDVDALEAKYLAYKREIDAQISTLAKMQGDTLVASLAKVKEEEIEARIRERFRSEIEALKLRIQQLENEKRGEVIVK